MPLGVVGVILSPLLTQAQPTLTEALDAAGLSWTTGGAADWFGIANSSAHDGLDAAQSGNVGDAQSTWLETTVTGPGIMGFWWKVASEPYFDVLEVVVNSNVLAEISGQQGWTEVQLELPEGQVTVRWQYRKDSSYSEEPDTAWLDAVSFNSTPVIAPSIVTQPQDLVLSVGSDGLLSVGGTGTETLHYQWRLNGTNLVDGPNVSGSTAPVLNLLAVKTNQAGVYSVTVSNSAGIVLSSNAAVTINPLVPLPVALDTPALSWSTGGHRAWAGQQVVTHDGVDAARSGGITDLEETWIETTVQGPGRLWFWWKVSSEDGFDELTLAIDGSAQVSISGEAGWTEMMFDIPVGSHALRWTYAKDIDMLGGQDAAWVDQVRFVRAPQVTEQPLGQIVVGGATVLLQAAVSGDPPLAFRWTKDGVPLPAATNLTLMLSGVIRSNSGAYALVATNVAGSTISSNAILLVRVPQLLTVPVRQLDGSVVLTARDADGNALQLKDVSGFSAWGTTNLINWTALPGSLSLSNGWLRLHDTNAPAFPRRLYQIREP